jgi:pilus assembly protein CpaE
MPLILVIDDEPFIHQMVAHALIPLQCDLHFADNGRSGVSQARQLKPDVIITDLMMPDIDGYEVTRLLRREPQFAATPILILTMQSGLHDKIKSFESGADDHMTKPFDDEELVARVTALLRRMQAVKLSERKAVIREGAHMIAVHSLRGGTGASTLAVNLGVGLFTLWREPTILLDMTMTAGQVALMLNMTLRRTWADIAHYPANKLDADALSSVIGIHESGVHFIAAPTFPSDAESLRGETLGMALQIAKSQYEYIVADLPHDFSEYAIQTLDAANLILMIASPDMASIRAVTAAMDTYEKLGYSKDKIKFVLSTPSPFPHSGLTREKIEGSLRMPALTTIPFVQNILVDAINLGQPPVYQKPNEPISGLLEDLAFRLSKDEHKKNRPENPTDTWKRVYKRYQERKR